MIQPRAPEPAGSLCILQLIVPLVGRSRIAGYGNPEFFSCLQPMRWRRLLQVGWSSRERQTLQAL